MNSSAKKQKSQPTSEQKPSKKLKIDHNEQVSVLFSGQLKSDFDPSSISIYQKRFIFKMINDLKDKQQKTSVDSIWKRFMTMNEKESINKMTGEPYVESKQQLYDIIEALDLDQLVSHQREDGTVIMI